MSVFSKLDIINIPLEGQNLIEASAGTGKTYAIANLFLRLLLEMELEVDSILVMTFSEAATEELRIRIRTLLLEAAGNIEKLDTRGDAALKVMVERVGAQKAASILRKAIVNFDEASIFTIHGFCGKVLSDNSFESSIFFDVELVTSQENIYEEIIDDFIRINFDCRFMCALAEALNVSDFFRNLFLKTVKAIENKPGIIFIPENIPRPEELKDVFFRITKLFSESFEKILGLLKELGISEESASRLKAEPFSGDSLLTLNEIALSAGKKIQDVGLSGPALEFIGLCGKFGALYGTAAESVNRKFAEYFRSELPARKKKLRIQHFSDILLNLKECLEDSDKSELLKNTVRKKYKAVMVDEFQDTDPVQYFIFERLFKLGNRPLFFIGDPKQSIYGFRSADIFAYLEAVAETGPNKRFTQDMNWRSETGFVKAMNSIFENLQNPFVLGEDKISYIPVKSSPASKGNLKKISMNGSDGANIEFRYMPCIDGAKHIKISDARRKAVVEVARDIASLLRKSDKNEAFIGDRPVSPADIAVLVFKNETAVQVKEALSKLNIPAVLKKSGSVFDSEEAFQLEKLLEAVAEPSRRIKVNTALFMPSTGIAALEILSMNENPEKIREYEKHSGVFCKLHEIWKRHGFFRMFRQYASEYSVRENLLSLPNGERKLTNMMHLAEALHRAESESGRGMNGLIEWLSGRRNGEAPEDEYELRLETDGQAVQIMTVFKSKGLQFPIVYCPFTWDRKADKTRSSEIIFHENGHLYSYTGEKAPGEYSRQASEEELAELMRLFYVALTRAQNKCLIYWGRINSTELTAPAYASCRGMEPGNIVAELKKQMKSFTDIELLEELRFFEDASGGTLKVNVIEEGGAEPGKILETEEAGKLSCRTMPGGRKISGQWGIMSFSSMASGKYSNDFHSAGFKEKFDDDKDISAGNSGVPAEGFFAFPAGPGPGTCLHAIMEKLDFTAVNSPEVEKLVTETIVMSGLKYSYGGNVEEYSDSTLEMLKRLVAAPFQPENGTGDFVLSDIPSRARLNEFEFYYPVKGMAVTELKNLFGRYSNDLKNGLPPESIERLKLDFSDGVMHGWIDMIFEYGGKYYIIDWKSNFLGTSFSDYTADKLRESLREHLYTLQYYIYSLALHKYLRERLENYSYDTCFGGVFYVFIRGVTPDVPGNGIFFDKPPEAFIREFESIQGVAHD